jgi:hypothetical protein
MPEWVVITFYVLFCIGLYCAFAIHASRKARRRLAAKRPSPTWAEFHDLMRRDVEADIAHWVWDELQVYYTPLAPHPDDHLLKDACIDEDDVWLDWPPEFARNQGLSPEDWPQWPDDWELTVRNYARWLSTGRAHLS